MLQTISLLLAALLALSFSSASAQSALPRVIVVTDIGNEPDDAESMVRLLLYSNELALEGLIASTSTWQRQQIRPELIGERIDAYEKVLPMLSTHAHGYPAPDALRRVLKRGRPEFGMTGVGDGKDSEGSEWIIAQADRLDARPLWILNWGGSVDLAQALYKVRKTRSADALRAFVAKLRVYSISDQDDAGPWVRRQFPDLFWIASIHATSDYALAAWYGISGDVKLDPQAQHIAGPDTSLVTNAWLDQHIRRGPLGLLYPRHLYIMEGDTPSFLYLLRADLSDPEHPEWGSWGGRYNRFDPQLPLFVDASDAVTGHDGRLYSSNQATVWRWRKAYQNDFAARIAWTLGTSGNHRPVAVLNGQEAMLRLTAKAGEIVKLSARGSRDPDGDTLSYRWFSYPEAGENARFRDVPLSAQTGDTTSLRAPDCQPCTWHVVLEVWDDGAPQLVAYRRAVITVEP